MTPYQKRIWNKVESQHGYAHHKTTHPVKELFNGKVVWEGEVEEFLLTANHQTDTCYGWAAKQDNGDEEITLVLGIDPVDSPQNAVKAAIAAHVVKTNRVRPKIPEAD